MVGSKGENAVLMAIKPCYSSKIFDGSKRVEFRKQAFKQPVTHVVVYESGTTGKIVGFFEILGLEEASPDELWDRYAEVGKIAEGAYQSYFSQRGKGVAIRIGNARRLAEPISLNVLAESTRAPQSFVYLGQSEFERLKSRKSVPVS